MLPHAGEPPRRPAFSNAEASFHPPGQQTLEYIHGLLKDERELRDVQDLASPEWFQHQRNVEFFEKYPASLEGHPGFDVKREREDLHKERAAIREHNQAVRKRSAAVQERIEKTGDRLMNLVELRWAVENHGRTTGRPVWGLVDSVPGLDAGDKTWYRRNEKKSIDIRGLTAVGVEREIVSLQAELRKLDAMKEKLATSERTTGLYPKLEFLSREEILARGSARG